MEKACFDFSRMGTRCSLQLYAKTRTHAKLVAKKVFDELLRIERRYSRYLRDSITTRINRSAGDPNGIEVDLETAAILDYAAVCYVQSEGLFDITSGVLRKAWDFSKNNLPSQQEVEGLLSKIGWEKIIWKNPKVVLPYPGMELDFGGVVKEYAADKVATLCREHQIEHGLIELGGDIHVVGPHPNGDPWQVGVQHPHNQEGVIATISLKEGGLATSGDYARCMEVAGKRYGHILNPKTGWPVTGLVSVSVMAVQCVIAGSASTVALLKGEEEGVVWLQTLGLPYLVMNQQGEVYGTVQ